MLITRNKCTLFVQVALIAMLFANCVEKNVFSSSSLSDIALSTEVDKQLKPGNPTTRFTMDSEMIYCSFQNNKAPTGALITIKWIYIGGEVKDLANYVIDEHPELVKKPGRMAMFLRKPTTGWPKGNYKIILSTNDIVEINIPFTVK
jgi:hypothetical protein